MSFLLDTHAFVWAVSAPEHLGPDASEAIESAAEPLYLSPVTAWEVATKVRLGKWPEAAPLAATLSIQVDALGVRELPVTIRDGELSGSLAWDHRDPFDRFLVAQALNNGLTIITKDPAITSHGISTVW